MAREPSAASAIAWIVPRGEGTSAEREREPGKPAADGHDERGLPALPDARRRQSVLRAPGGDGEGQPGGSADGDALEPAPDLEVEADQRGEAPACQPLDRGADEAAAQRAGGRQGERRAGRARPPRRTRGPRRRRRRPARRSRRRSPPGPERWRSARCCPAWPRGPARRRRRRRSRPGRRPPRPRSILSRRTARHAAIAATAVHRSSPAAATAAAGWAVGHEASSSSSITSGWTNW